MRADVLIPERTYTPKAHGWPSVGFHVAITGWDALSVHGNLRQTWDALLAGRSLDDHARVSSLVGDASRALRLAHHVSSDVIRDRLDSDAALIVGTSKGGVEEWLTTPPPVAPNESTSENLQGGLRPEFLADIASELASTLGVRGPRMTLSAACASGLHALIRGAMMIRSGQLRQALIVATEASVHPLFLGSFQRLGVLAKPGDGCRPFDENRTGFYMTEAAAAVLLERAGSDGSPGVFVEGFAQGGDATHLTAGDPAGSTLRRLLTRVIDGRPVDLVHAHGTGTILNDATELAAIEQSVGESAPIVYSHKAALGHSLGASGLLSVVLNCMSHATGMVPPNVRTTTPLPTRRTTLPRSVTRRAANRSVAIASGFGGPLAVVSLVSNR